MPGFEKDENSLFPVHVHVDSLGFVWVNLEASQRPSTPWAEDFEGVDTQPRFSVFDMGSFKFEYTWSMIGDYNWKTLADNYNEACSAALVPPQTLWQQGLGF